MLLISNIKLLVNHTENDVTKKIAKILRCNQSDIKEIEILKKSIDARKKNEIYFVYSFKVNVKNETRFLSNKNVTKFIAKTYVNLKPTKTYETRPVVVGAGPAGLFAALILAEASQNPIIVERGKDVDSRILDINNFWSNTKLDAQSNVQFGEGGAGTFSDGKLTTNIKDIRIEKIYDEFVKAGAPHEIKYVSKPHLGTDNLINIIKNIRKKIIALGGEFRFSNKLIDFEIENNFKKLIVENLLTLEKNEIITENVVLAIGHSARDTFKMLHENKLNISQKAFAVGVRIEHKQSFINEIQYGNFSKSENLGAADYKLNVHLQNGRGVYTFCMCPGGVVVPSSSELNTVVTNGMSYFKRNKENANSALLVSVNTSDFGSNEPLAGMYFQQKLEKNAFLLGGSNYNAPVQLVGDFLQNKESTKIGEVVPSYKIGFKPTNLTHCLDDFIVNSLKEGIVEIDKNFKGFANEEAVLTGVETRSSSPITIVRNEHLQANFSGIYPCGEGAGYAGGIISAAVDGIKCAEKIISN